jgi:hypothetical protein
MLVTLGMAEVRAILHHLPCSIVAACQARMVPCTFVCSCTLNIYICMSTSSCISYLLLLACYITGLPTEAPVTTCHSSVPNSPLTCADRADDCRSWLQPMWHQMVVSRLAITMLIGPCNDAQCKPRGCCAGQPNYKRDAMLRKSIGCPERW